MSGVTHQALPSIRSCLIAAQMLAAELPMETAWLRGAATGLHDAEPDQLQAIAARVDRAHELMQHLVGWLRGGATLASDPPATASPAPPKVPAVSAGTAATVRPVETTRPDGPVRVSFREFLTRLDRSPAWLYKAIASGDVIPPPIKDGARVYWPLDYVLSVSTAGVKAARRAKKKE